MISSTNNLSHNNSEFINIIQSSDMDSAKLATRNFLTSSLQSKDSKLDQLVKLAKQTFTDQQERRELILTGIYDALTELQVEQKVESEDLYEHQMILSPPGRMKTLTKSIELAANSLKSAIPQRDPSIFHIELKDADRARSITEQFLNSPTQNSDSKLVQIVQFAKQISTGTHEQQEIILYEIYEVLQEQQLKQSIRSEDIFEKRMDFSPISRRKLITGAIEKAANSLKSQYLDSNSISQTTVKAAPSFPSQTLQLLQSSQSFQPIPSQSLSTRSNNLPLLQIPHDHLDHMSRVKNDLIFDQLLKQISSQLDLLVNNSPVYKQISDIVNDKEQLNNEINSHLNIIKEYVKYEARKIERHLTHHTPEILEKIILGLEKYYFYKKSLEISLEIVRSSENPQIKEASSYALDQDKQFKFIMKNWPKYAKDFVPSTERPEKPRLSDKQLDKFVKIMKLEPNLSVKKGTKVIFNYWKEAYEFCRSLQDTKNIDLQKKGKEFELTLFLNEQHHLYLHLAGIYNTNDSRFEKYENLVDYLRVDIDYQLRITPTIPCPSDFIQK